MITNLKKCSFFWTSDVHEFKKCSSIWKKSKKFRNLIKNIRGFEKSHEYKKFMSLKKHLRIWKKWKMKIKIKTENKGKRRNRFPEPSQNRRENPRNEPAHRQDRRVGGTCLIGIHRPVQGIGSTLHTAPRKKDNLHESRCILIRWLMAWMKHSWVLANPY